MVGLAWQNNGQIWLKHDLVVARLLIRVLSLSLRYSGLFKLRSPSERQVYPMKKA